MEMRQPSLGTYSLSGAKTQKIRGGPPKRGWWSERGQEQRHEETNGCLVGNKGQGAGGSGSATRHQVNWAHWKQSQVAETLEEP